MKCFSLGMIILVGLLMGGCSKPPAERILFDFETDGELDQFHWKCHTLFALSDEHFTHGTKSLKLELYPSEYPGLAHMIKNTNWSYYRVLRFDVYNAQDNDINLSVRIDDSKDYPDYADRYNRSFKLSPGPNKISIPFWSLVTSGTNRQLNSKMIYRVVMFVVRPEKKIILFFDNIRLVLDVDSR